MMGVRMGIVGRRRDLLRRLGIQGRGSLRLVKRGERRGRCTKEPQVHGRCRLLYDVGDQVFKLVTIWLRAVSMKESGFYLGHLRGSMERCERTRRSIISV